MDAAFSYDGIIGRILEVNPWGSEGKLAENLGISPNTWTAYKRGDRSFGLHEIAKISDTLSVDPRWLLLGDTVGPHHEDVVSATEGFSLIPRYAVRVSAGTGLAALEHYEADRLAFRTEWLRDMGLNPQFCGLVTAAGDSMEPTIPNGSILLVDMLEGQQLRSGCLYVVVLDGDLLVKRLMRRIDGTIELISDNSIYPKEIIPPGYIDRITIPGRVVWFGRSV